MKKTNGTRSVKCPYCPVAHSNKKALDAHISWAHGASRGSNEGAIRGHESGRFKTPVPGLTIEEDKVLRQIIIWADEYIRRQKENVRYSRQFIPTTEKCTKHFKYKRHEDMLRLLNNLERSGLVEKERRQSAGLSGNGYDGALHSSVLPTEKARDFVARYS